MFNVDAVKVETDKEFYSKFNEIKESIEKMSTIFEKEGTELTLIQLGDWNMIVNQTKKDFNKLIKEANSRVVPISKR